MHIGIFTTLKIKNGIPLFSEKHQKRLTDHGKALGFPSPPLDLEKQIVTYLTQNNLQNCSLHITVQQNNEITFQHRELPKIKKGVKVISLPDTRDATKIYKTTNRLVNEKAKKIAEKKGTDDALFVKDQKFIESTICNIFSLNKKGEIITPPLAGKGLKGITRQLIMENIKVIEEDIPENTNGPLVLVNSLRIQKVSHINGKKLQNAEKLLQRIKKIIDLAEKSYSKKSFIHYQQLSDWIDPEDNFITLFAKEQNAFWLDSNLPNDKNRFSYMGIPTEIITYSIKAKKIIVQKKVTTKQIDKNIFFYLNQQLKKRLIRNSDLPFPFIGGYVGYFGYELKNNQKKQQKYISPYPDSLWYFTTQTIVFDHQEKKVFLVCLAKNKTAAEKWFGEIKKKLQILRHPETKPIHHNNSQINFHLDRNHQQYLKDIAICKKYLAKGESYQICLTNTLTTKTKTDPFHIYQTLRKINPAPYAAYIKYNDLSILSSSPEEFLKIDQNGIVETKPIKGTRKRGRTKVEDKKLTKQLQSSKKDWSENAMIVDLLRNDLGKVCEFGSVKVEKLMDIESYETVHQLVSTIKGKLRNDVTLIDCIKACFPGGSMTGAPKLRSMEILEDLEKKTRGIYSGTLGFLSLNQTALLAIVIRTMIIKNNTVTIGTGGAILIDSDPQKEYEEMLLKAKALTEAILKNA